MEQGQREKTEKKSLFPSFPPVQIRARRRDRLPVARRVPGPSTLNHLPRQNEAAAGQPSTNKGLHEYKAVFVVGDHNASQFNDESAVNCARWCNGLRLSTRQNSRE